MKYKKPLLCIAGAILLAGCGGPAHPEEAEVKQTIAGSYCSEEAGYRVDLNADGTYEARRSSKGALATGRFGEKCSGPFTLVYDEDAHVWNLNFEKATKHSNPFVQCPGHSVTVWKLEGEYQKSGEFLKITDPFDQTTLIKNCGGGAL